jgi:NAD-dependent dihydropyrimidine dehydrogenase PreA subunit
MSKTWYPVINHELCKECGKCVEKCEHGVYNKSKAPRPVVVFPEGCIQGCHGCGKLCQSSAIEYVGDVSKTNGAGCGCGCHV